MPVGCIATGKQERATQLLVGGMGYKAVSRAIGSCPKSVSAFAKSIGIIRLTNKDKGKNLASHTCPQCGLGYMEYASANKQYCSSSCHNISITTWTEARIQEALILLSDINGFVNSVGHPTLHTVASRMYGSWDAACGSIGCKRKRDVQSTCLICNKELEQGGSRVRFCSDECLTKGQHARWSSYGHIRRSEYSKGDIISKIAIYERDGWKCHICGKKINPNTKHPSPLSASIDHLVPLSKGGRHERANVMAAHLGCNSKKGNRSRQEQLMMFG